MIDNQTRALGLVGVGGMGREAMSFLRGSAAHDELYFVQSLPEASDWSGVPVLSTEEFLGLPDRDLLFNVSVSDHATRQMLTEQFVAGGATPHTVIHPGAEIGLGVDIAPGALISAFSFIGADVRIGAMFHCNVNSALHHDCVVGDYVTFGPRVQCNGNVTIGDHAYVGAGAIIRNGQPGRPLRIGAGATVGMGAVVTHDVAPNAVVSGNPARLHPSPVGD